MPARTKATFIEPMLLLRKETLPTDASRWEYQLKLGGFRDASREDKAPKDVRRE